MPKFSVLVGVNGDWTEGSFEQALDEVLAKSDLDCPVIYSCYEDDPETEE